MEALYNRIVKVNRHISKWAKRNNVTCYRIFDHDIPEYPFCIDKYNDFLHVAEYASKNKFIDEDEHQQWLTSAITTIGNALQLPTEHIFLKQRKKIDRRNEQYEKIASNNERMIVTENDLKFHVNLQDYLDTGLFLDHRPLRQTFKKEANKMRVLNLFAYTGAFSVYAAMGNAEKVTTVDLSNTYIQWAKDNFLLNNLDINAHDFVVMDTMEYLKSLKKDEPLFDLVFVDPPVFSNSSKLKKGTWDTQRDHTTLLHLILQVLEPGGIIYFSNNLKSFTPEFERLEATSIEDIREQTIPEDFRNKYIHWCWKIIK
jgi:23S rRNA (cytosine1962-C5)-methyltransferase